MNYCPKCGLKLSVKEIELEGLIPYCKNCDKLYFPHDSCCVIGIIKINNKFLLIKQNYLAKHYVLVGGHVKKGETAEETMINEVKEEVNLDVKKLTYLKSYAYLKDEHLMLGYFLECEGVIKPNHEVDSFKLFTYLEALEALKESKVAKYLFIEAKEKGLI